MAAPPPISPLVSVIIVNYKVPEFTLQVLRSLREAERADCCEIIIVDNASQDDSRERITAQFPGAAWIGLKNNIGFGRACNVGAQHAAGDYLLFLNPDTVVSRNSISDCIAFFDSHPDTAVVGPKIIGPDGRFEPASRRSFPTPFNAFCRLFGLAFLFPRSRRFGRYNLTYLDPDTPAEVDAISGSFMFMRASVFRRIGGFDEEFFLYGEDLDLCVRIRELGYKVWYLPSIQIVHFKGRSAARQPLRSRVAFYEAMVLFSRKYRHSYGSFFPGWLINLGIMLKAAFNIGATVLASFAACFIDLLVVNTILWAAMFLRFRLASMDNPYREVPVMLAMHAVLSLCFLVTYALQGMYSTVRYTPRRALWAGVLASTIFVAGMYFSQFMAFSRIAFAFSAFAASFALVGWREIFTRFRTGVRRMAAATGRVIVLGEGDIARALIRGYEKDRTAKIAGILWPRHETYPGQFEGYPVLGAIDGLKHVLEITRADLLLVATAEPWYSYFIEALAGRRIGHMKVKWVRPELIREYGANPPDEIPLQDFTI